MLVACSADGRYADTSDGQVDEQGGVTLIAPKTLAERIADGEAIQLIDVRTPEEFAEGHVVLRNMIDRTEKQISLDELITDPKSVLNL